MATMSEKARSGTSNVEVGTLLEQLEAVIADARALTADLSAEQFNWRPTAHSWSVGQCLEHLTLTARLYVEPMERMLGEARLRHESGARPYREGWFTNWFVRSMEPPPKLRIRTFTKVDPPPALDRTAVSTSFEAVHRALADRIARAEDAWLAQARMASPFTSLLRFTFRQVCRIIIGHARRHLWQARQVRAAPDFPAA